MNQCVKELVIHITLLSYFVEKENAAKTSNSGNRISLHRFSSVAQLSVDKTDVACRLLLSTL